MYDKLAWIKIETSLNLFSFKLHRIVYVVFEVVEDDPVDMKLWLKQRIDNFKTADGKQLLALNLGMFECITSVPCKFFSYSVISLFVPSILFVILLKITGGNSLCGILVPAAFPIIKILGKWNIFLLSYRLLQLRLTHQFFFIEPKNDNSLSEM